MTLKERPSSLHSRTQIEFRSRPPSLNIAQQISGPLILSVLLFGNRRHGHVSVFRCA